MTMKRISARSTAVGSALVAAMLLVCRAPAEPPSPQLGMWNEDDTKLAAGTLPAVQAWLAQRKARKIWNCYNYAIDQKTTDANGDPVRAHPGKGKKWPNIGKNITAADMCTKVKARAKQDGLNNVTWTAGDPIPVLPDGQNLVALGATAGPKGDGGDYHWWRLNGDDTWSHKRGSTKAKTTYTDNLGQEQLLTDPRQAGQRDGYDLCGFLSVKKDSPPDAGPLAAATGCGPGPGRVVLCPLVLAGYTDPEMPLGELELGLILPALPTLDLTNQVPNPNWGGVPAGQPAGFEIFFDEAHPDKFLPLYLRAFQNVVEVLHFQQDLGQWGLFYYNDNHGLEPLLQLIFSPPIGACCDLNGLCEIAPSCTCQELGGTYWGDGTPCEVVLCDVFCPWDCDPSGDGNVNVADLLALLGQFDANAPGNCNGGSCDFNGDGCVTVVDLLKLLAHYSTAPQGIGCP